MGQFTSRCLKCKEPHYWFLEARDHICRNCGNFMSAEEIAEIWHKDCRDHYQSLDLRNKKYTFTDKELEEASLDKLPNIVFNCGAENSREQELRMALGIHYRCTGRWAPPITFMPKDNWKDLLAMEKD